MVMDMDGQLGRILVREDPVGSVDEYLDAGGGRGLAAARSLSPGEVIERVRRSGLRGRGGAGFPTGVKWRTVREDPCPTKYVVANGAEGEPGTFKDRWLLRHNPYLVVEGVAIAAHAVGAERAFIGVKAGFEREIARLTDAMRDMAMHDLLGPVPIELTPGPDEYLLGEEKALLEVIEGNDPLPRTVPPWMEGLFRRPGSPNPTVANNVETLANVPLILDRGPEWFRSFGTEDSPGTMLFTLSGDVRLPGVYELPLGYSLRDLVEGIGGGVPEGRRLKAIFPGASNTIVTEEQLDTPLAFDTMRAVGAGLGSGGFVVYDDSACILARAFTVTDAQRCALPTGESLIAQSAVQLFGREFAEHFGRPCPSPREIPVPKLVDFDERTGGFRLDERYHLKRPDWTYADEI